MRAVAHAYELGRSPLSGVSHAWPAGRRQNGRARRVPSRVLCLE